MLRALFPVSHDWRLERIRGRRFAVANGTIDQIVLKMSTILEISGAMGTCGGYTPGKIW